ncbi:MAG: rRNA methyltransferase [Phycisphaerae bacterium]|nr:rRNA methyltransferase [Phycisphaerae bacterium]
MNRPCLINSLDDPRVDAFRDVRDRDLRGRDGFFMAESELVLRRLLRQPERLHSLLVSREKWGRLESELRDLPDSIPIYVADLDVIGEVAGFHVHRGVLALGHRPDARELSMTHVLEGLDRSRPRTLLLATGITNVDNMGSLFRNAAAFGIDAIILDGTCCDPLYRKSIRVSMGHVLGVPWAVTEDWIGSLGELKDRWGVHLVAAECDERSRCVSVFPFPEHVALIVGAEGAGLDEGTRSICDSIVEIPMAREVPSLNVATAAAIFMWERRRSSLVEK